MPKISIPTPPARGKHYKALIQEGAKVGFIWLFHEAARGTIETQYADARAVGHTLAVSRASAYRFMAKQEKVYWLIDLTDEDNPRCCRVVPRDTMVGYIKPKTGNPNFANGIYQQQIAKRRVRH